MRPRNGQLVAGRFLALAGIAPYCMRSPLTQAKQGPSKQTPSVFLYLCLKASQSGSEIAATATGRRRVQAKVRNMVASRNLKALVLLFKPSSSQNARMSSASAFTRILHRKRHEACPSESALHFGQMQVWLLLLDPSC